ncbi:MAG: polysaccharide pyruvyl transferase family protein [Limisphaerales bacterium]
MSQSPTFTGGWAKILLQLMNQVEQAGIGPNKLVFGSRFKTLLTENPGEDRLIAVDENRLYRQISEGSKNGNSLNQLYVDLNSESSSESLIGTALLDEIIRHLKGFEPRLIFSFGSRADFFLKAFPNARVIHLEKSAFSRGSFPDALTFDPVGIYRTSVTAQGHLFPKTDIHPDYLSIAGSFQSQAIQKLTAGNPFRNNAKLYGEKKKLLIPLQVSGYPALDTQTQYTSQFEYLYDCLAKIPTNVDVVVTEYAAWGRVLTTKDPHNNLEFLKTSFSNIIFDEQFRSVPFSSQYLLPYVDFVWTIASSVGLQSAFLNIPTGSPSNTQNSAATIADSLIDLLETDPADRDVSTNLCANYLAYNSIPSSFWDNSRSVQRAFEIFTDPLDNCLWSRPLVLPEEIEALVINGLNSSKAQPPEPRLNFDISIHEEAYLRGNRHSPTISALSQHKTKFIILNDTRPIEGFIHFGCNVVVETIISRLENSDMQLFGIANTFEECQNLEKNQGFEEVSLIVLNGEGSLHHDNSRCLGLLQFCQAMKDSGRHCVLLNSSWFDNSSSYASYLSAFDLISVRESQSLEQISKHRSDAVLVPDFSIASAHNVAIKSDKLSNKDNSRQLCIFDNVIPEVGFELFDFARSNEAPFFIMGPLNYAYLSEQNSKDAEHPWKPKVFESLNDLIPFGYSISGRFHGLTVCLAALRPTLALPSNTPKIESFLSDAGIKEIALLPSEWLGLNGADKLNIVQEKFSSWDELRTKSLLEYIEFALDATNKLFEHLKQFR